MTQKELLYMEDAIKHETNLMDICDFILQNLDDKNLITFMKNQRKKHENLKQKLLNTMEELA